MTNPQMDALQPILTELVALSERRAASRPPLTGEELTRLRAELRARFVAARESLGRSVSERDAYLYLFPLVVTADELVQTLLPELGRPPWLPLQKDLFDTEHGGELFYALLDEVLETGMASAQIYEVFAFCLRLGFRGRLLGDEDRAAAYLAKLTDRLSGTRLPPAPAFEAEPAVRSLRAPISKWWYYGAALLAVLLCWLVLDSVAQRQAVDLVTRGVTH